MTDYDRGETREPHESPFQTLSRQVAGLQVKDGDTTSQGELYDEPKVVEVIQSMCMNCEENVRIAPELWASLSNHPNREKHGYSSLRFPISGKSS